MSRIPFIRIGLFIAILPILLAFITSLFTHSSLFDEGSGSGVYLWLLIVSVPGGLICVGLGLIVLLIKHLRHKK